MKMKNLRDEYLRARKMWEEQCLYTLCVQYAGREFKFIIPMLVLCDMVNDEFVRVQAVRGSSDEDDCPVIEVQKTTGEWVDTYTIGVDEKKIFMKIDWEEL